MEKSLQKPDVYNLQNSKRANQNNGLATAGLEGENHV